MIITLLSFFLVLGVLVFFHELGHYWVARRNGIVVEEFGLGYPPRMIRLFRYDGTDFTLNWIPFGGFARMKGEDAGDDSTGSLNSASTGARAATMIAGPAMNALLAIVLFAASFMAGFPAVVGAPQITETSDASQAAALGLQPDDILLSLNGQPVEVSAVPNFDFRVMAEEDAAGEEDITSSAGTLVVSRNGALVDVAVSPALDDVEELLGGAGYTPVLTTQVAMVVEGTPAEQAGLQAEDLIYAVDGEVVSFANPLNEIVERKLGQQVSMTVWRDGGWHTLAATPRAEPPPGEGALGVQIGPVSRLATLSLPAALWEGVVNTGQYFVLVLQLPVMLIMGQLSPNEAQLTGPVGIAQLVGGAVSATIDTGLWFPIWRLSAVLSAALAVTNLLPLPALDGGRLVFILIEALRGRRINPEREGYIHMVGFMLLLGLLVLITVRDITGAQQGIDWMTILGQ